MEKMEVWRASYRSGETRWIVAVPAPRSAGHDGVSICLRVQTFAEAIRIVDAVIAGTWHWIGEWIG